MVSLVTGDVHAVAEAMTGRGRLVEADGMDSGVLKAGNANALVAGSVVNGAVVRGEQCVVIEGSITGIAARPCQIQVEGDAVIIGDVEHASITCRSLRIGGAGRACQLAAREDIAIGEELRDAQVVSGHFDKSRRRMEALQSTIARSGEDRESLERDVNLHERRMAKLLRTTTAGIKVELGQLVQLRRNRIRVDLGPFYKLVGEKSEEELDAALLEFFTRGVVGVLAKANQHVIVANATRQKVFVQTVENLRGLFLAARTLDRHDRGIERVEEELRALAETSRERVSAVYVGGGLAPEVDLSFVQPRVEETEEGELNVSQQVGKMLLKVNDGGDPQVIKVDLDGVTEDLFPEAGELENVALRLQSGNVVWEQN